MSDLKGNILLQSPSVSTTPALDINSLEEPVSTTIVRYR
jgi:hypothetical protein